ncbi:MAG TPA: dimethylamine monooxygenase subunit DmmA family protein [Methylophilaceae bacterium]|nr:dimethylamine monooxygenase subunit DmmA family protein [Methylophilaceae bacterium]
MERGYWIKSKPIYSSLAWHEKATSHLVLAQGSGGMAVLKLFQQMHPPQPVSVIYSRASAVGADYTNPLQKTIADGLWLCENEQQALAALETALPAARMGMRLYVAGSEHFIWAVAGSVKHYGVEDADIMKELTDTLARSVYCVHCKAITHNIRTNIGQCSGCARMLFVRDHFSRRFGAYMGFMVDAESPGELPQIEEIYP